MRVKSIKTFKHHSVSNEYLYMKSEMHNIQKIEKPKILQTLIMELQIKMVLKAGFKICFQKLFLHLQFSSKSRSLLSACSLVIAYCDHNHY